MELRRKSAFLAIDSEGGLLPPDLLVRVSRLDRTLPGVTLADYALDGERQSEAITRSYQTMMDAYARLKSKLGSSTIGDDAVGITRDFLSRLFVQLGYGLLEKQDPATNLLDGKHYPISHSWRQVPIHIVGWHAGLDQRMKPERPATDGLPTAIASPHGLVQEYLNRSDAHLWAIVSNGRALRLLRDNARLTRPSYVEFDLERIFEGDLYSDFALLWLVTHATRLAADKPGNCVLEKWSKAAHDDGTRVLDELRDGVKNAIIALGSGFLRQPENRKLRESLVSGDLTRDDYYRLLLRLVYRLIFTSVAEERDVLMLPSKQALPGARERYEKWYSLKRLRRLSEKRRGSRHRDLWTQLRIVHEKLDESGCPELALPALGSFLWSPQAISQLGECDLSNEDFLDAIHHLCFVVEKGVRRAVNWRDIGPEELGGIYESLLEQHADLNVEARTFTLLTEAGSERKTTGSYYTPESLVQCLLETALDPVLDEACKQESRGAAERAILALKVCDPACGSGHFLIAAAHRIAKRLARVRTGDEEPSPEERRKALRDVVGRCIYGVDANDMAVELCKVNLWLEALDPGRPLSFLDHQIQHGNALLGATPALIENGIPDEAFEPIAGDDKEVLRGLKRQNRDDRKNRNQRTIFASFAADSPPAYGSLHASVTDLALVGDDTLESVRTKETLYGKLRGSEAYATMRLTGDAFCSAFVIEKTKDKPALTDSVFRDLVREPSKVASTLRTEIARLREQYGFFHWHVAFPDVFEASADGRDWKGGFDAVLGNPPWEHVELKEIEFFAARSAAIATAVTGSARKAAIERLRTGDPRLFEDYRAHLRGFDGARHFLANSDRFPFCGRGRINTYSVFAETMRGLISPIGRVGCIVPSGIATDDTTKVFFQSLVESRSLASLYDFENRDGIFPGIDRRIKFSLVTLIGSQRPSATGAEFAFFLLGTGELTDPERRFQLSAQDIALLNPNTRTCPIFRSRRDAEITKAIYRRVPVLVRNDDPSGNPWGVRIRRVFNMGQVETERLCVRAAMPPHEMQRPLPMYESKMVHQFTHRWGDYAIKVAESEDTQLPDIPDERLDEPSYVVQPRYWIPESEVDSRLAGRWSRRWLLGWRDICRSTDERTLIAAAIPRAGTDFTLRIAIEFAQPTEAAIGLLSQLNSFVVDYIARQSLGGTHMSDYVTEQIAVLPPNNLADVLPGSRATRREWLRVRVLELTYVANDLEPFARDLGYIGPPFRWNTERRFLLRCELDAAFFHLYGIVRDDVAYILDTFPIVRRHDEKAHGEYRTKRVILEIYDRMAAAIAGGPPFDTVLDPPPADFRAAHQSACIMSGSCSCTSATDTGALSTRVRPFGENVDRSRIRSEQP